MTKQQFAAVVLELKNRLDDADKVLADIQQLEIQVNTLRNNTIERSKLMGAALCRLIALEQGKTFEAVFKCHTDAVEKNKTGREYINAVLGN